MAAAEYLAGLIPQAVEVVRSSTAGAMGVQVRDLGAAARSAPERFSRAIAKAWSDWLTENAAKIAWDEVTLSFQLQ
jgi:hypothetical protein